MKRGRYIFLTSAVLMIAVLLVHVYSLDGLHGSLAAAVLNEDTVYSAGYSDRLFRQVKPGMLEADLPVELQSPAREVWIYRRGGISIASVDFAGDRVIHVNDETDARLSKISTGMTKGEVQQLIGPPPEKSFVYSFSPGDRNHRKRVIIMSDGRVVEKIAYFYLD